MRISSVSSMYENHYFMHFVLICFGFSSRWLNPFFFCSIYAASLATVANSQQAGSVKMVQEQVAAFAICLVSGKFQGLKNLSTLKSS